MKRPLLLLASLLLASLACQTLAANPAPTGATSPTVAPTNTAPAPETPPPTPPSTPAEPTRSPQTPPDQPGEPVAVSGDIPYTSPFFVHSLAEPFVLLEDQAGFVRRDRNFTFPLESQTIGPVEILPNDKLRYSLALPKQPQATFVDVDNNGQPDTGVQVFAIAFWSNTWGGPFLEQRDGYGWSTGSASTITDPDRHGEIAGGTLLIWAPDDQQGFPTGFGEDGLLFTADDPVEPVPAGYTYVNLDGEPFRFYKEAHAELTLPEGAGAVNDFSKLGYSQAFEAMLEKVSREYPFTAEKGVDWAALHAEFAPRFASAATFEAYYLALHDFIQRIPDAHVGMTLDGNTFYQHFGGGFGLVLAELTGGKVVVASTIPGETGPLAGVVAGAEILEWDGQPVGDAVSQAESFFGPYSTPWSERLDQLIFLTRYPVATRLRVKFQNPGSAPQEATLTAQAEYESLFASIPAFQEDNFALPIEAKMLASGVAYVRIDSFLDDFNLMARLWERVIDALVENEVPGLILDIRVNGGGSGGLARDFAGYFFADGFEVDRRSYYNERTGAFEYLAEAATLEPGPAHYDGPIVVLIGPHCVSACEGFAYVMAHDGRATLAGHFPTAGAYGEVGRGQYDMPGDISMQFPTGRPETPEGALLIEGTGVPPDILVPVSLAAALGQEDAVLLAGEQALLDLIGP